MKSLFLMLMIVLSFNANAQIKSVALQASGLTCSMCSRSIFKSLKSLDFVDKIDADIKTSTFTITFKQDSNVDIDKLKKKVEDAGFFVADLKATIHFDSIAVANDNHVTVAGNVFHFLNVKDQVLNGDKTIRVIDKGFVSAKEYKKNGKYTLMECYKTGVAGSCCSKGGLAKGTRIFHVTI
ncbi:heavy-metal-associated domain-containing protein [Ferruginibacter sp. SUN002]|uniref:heavy-metal-associated domain-containing protein n=1 Tax=Ferruginibacter sp. SUN002 TaxID=2937789 RepID=UPI003D36A6FB